MRFISASFKERHSAACVSLSVSSAGDIVSASVDGSIWMWNAHGEIVSKVDLSAVKGALPTFVEWLPSGSAANRNSGLFAVFVASFTDGVLRFFNSSSGKEEKTVNAHTGAICALCLSSDGSKMFTAGAEDRKLNSWSSGGAFLGLMTITEHSVNSMCWGYERERYGGECVLLCAGREVHVVPLQSGVGRGARWVAHKSPILTCEWSRMSGLIVTGSEDRCFKIWDALGTIVFSSQLGDYPVTSVRFSPDGELLAVGSLHNLRVCDKNGWTHCCQEISQVVAVGSMMIMRWMPDGTQIVCGSGSGDLIVSQLVQRRLLWKQYCVETVDSKLLLVKNIADQKTPAKELLHREAVVSFSVAYGLIVLCTKRQCIVYNLERGTNLCSLDITNSVVTLLQCERLFATADSVGRISVYTYDGHVVDTVHLGGSQGTQQPESMVRRYLTLSNDTIVAKNPANPCSLLFFDLNSGPSRGSTDAFAELIHCSEVSEVQLSQSPQKVDRLAAFIDTRRTLYIVGARGGKAAIPPVRLAGPVGSMLWHNSMEALSVVIDGSVTVWLCPSGINTDKDLIPTLRVRVGESWGGEWGLNDRIISYTDSFLTMCRGSDGAEILLSGSPAPQILYSYICINKWSAATRLCRQLNKTYAWAMLAVMAVKRGELSVAVIAYGALGDISKVHYIEYIESLQNPVRRLAELALFSHRPAEAETLFLQNGLLYRCLETHCRTGNWLRALDLAIEKRSHVDTVLAFRQKYLKDLGQHEIVEKYKKVAASVKVNMDLVEEKISAEEEKENSRG